MKQQKIATIFGATGFIGRYITQELATQGYIIRAATRNPNKAYFLKPYGQIGQVVPFPCDGSKKDIESAITGADLVVNCVGILFEKKKSTFMKTHSDFPEVIAKICTKKQVKRFIHISALACDIGTSKYAKSKLAGESKVLKAFPDAVILRPSVVFGAEDQFFNMFARLGRVLPVLPLIGGGNTKFQPVSVKDIARAAQQIATAKSADFAQYSGQIFELGGPDIVTFKEIYALLKRHAGVNFVTIPLPWGIAKAEAALLSLLPKPLLTTDQVEALKTDNILSPKSKGFKQLNIIPSSMDTVLPDYLGQYSYKPQKQEAA
jgi:NADH dehydrogenase